MADKLTSSEGERRAMLGYIPQYRLCAEIAYEALIKGRLEWLQLLSDDAGQVDDFLIGSPDRFDAFQVKHGEEAETYTLNSLLRPGKTPGGKPTDSLVRQMAVGWLRLTNGNLAQDVHVHLVLRGIPTKIGKIESLTSDLRQGSFQEFLTDCWRRESSEGQHKLKGNDWTSVLECIERCSKLTPNEFKAFRTHCHFEFRPKLDSSTAIADDCDRSRESDIEKLKLHLLNLASADIKPGQIQREQLLRDLSWEGRFRAAYPHEFRIDPRYQPIPTTVEAIQKSVVQFSRGYFVLVGSPGSGKSTVLTHTMRRLGNCRLVRYYAFIPDDALLNRGEAQSFFHDVVVQLRQLGIRGRKGFAPDSLAELQDEFSSQLDALATEWRESGKKTVILVDGLDHIEREQNPIRSLLAALPPPHAIPEGVLICLGSQKKELQDLSPAIVNQLDEAGRTIEMAKLNRSAVNLYLAASNLRFPLTSAQIEMVFALSEGHPLALALLVEHLTQVENEAETQTVLNDTTPFQGHIEKGYGVHWQKLESEGDVVRLLAYVSRMRGNANLKSLLGLVDEAAITKLRRLAKPYLHFSKPTQCKCFHNSFRQFVLSNTGRDAFGQTDREKHRLFHRELAAAAMKLPLSSPFAWEAVYHTHCAEDFERLIEIAAADYFRAQVRGLRYPRALFDDLRLAFGAAGKLNRPLAAMSLALISREVQRRYRWRDEMDLPPLLLSLRGTEACLQQVMRDGLLVVTPSEGLRISGDLLDAQDESDARNLFEISEPVSILEGSDSVEIHSQHDGSELSAWASVASRFRPVVDVLGAIMRASINIDSRRSFGVHAPEDLIRHHRLECVKEVLRTLVDEGDWARLGEAVEFLADHESFKDMQRFVDWRICSKHPRGPRASASLQRLTAAFENSTDLSTLLFLANNAWRVQRDAGAVEKHLKRCPNPKTPTHYEIGDRLAAFQDRLIYSRLLAIVGRPVRTVDAVPLPSDSKQVLAARVDRAVAEVGTLWGRGIAGHKADQGEIRNLTSSFIRFFDQEFRHSDNHWDWHSVQRQCPTLFEWLVLAAAAHGSEALIVVADEFDQRCMVKPPRWPWSFDHQREIALTLFEADGDKSGLIRRLERVEVVPEADDDPNSRVIEKRSQTLAWLRAGEKERAEACFARMLEGACGIQSGDEDDEARFWVEWFARQVSADDPELPKDIQLLSSILSVLAKNGRGRLVDEGMRRLGVVAGRFGDAWAHHLWSWWFAQGSATWTEAIRGILLSLINSGRIPLEVIGIAIRRLLLPWEIGPDGEISDAFTSAVYTRYADGQAEMLWKPMIHTLSTKAFPRVRKSWFEAISRVADRAGRLPPTMPLFEIEKEPEPTPTPAHEPTLKLADGSEQPLDAALASVDSVESAISLLKQNSYAYSIREERLATLVFDRLKDANHDVFAEQAIGNLSEPNILSVISKRLRATGSAKPALAVAEHALKCARVNGWMTMYDGGTCLAAASAVVEANPSEGRRLVFQCWLRDIISGEAGIPELFAEIDKLPPLIFESVPHKDLWHLLRKHALHFVEAKDEPNRLPALPSFTSRPLGDEVLVWLERGCELGVPQLEDECSSGIHEMMQLIQCDESVELLFRRWLSSDDPSRVRALGLLRSIHTIRPEFPLRFGDAIKGCQQSPSYVARCSASALTKALGFQPVELPAAPQKLSPLYSLVLPGIHEPEHRIPSDLYGPGKVTPESEDYWEWVGIVQDELEILAEHSAIPLQNLARRAAALMLEVAPRETWDSSAELNLKERIQIAGLRISYRRPRAIVATRALDRMLCELMDAGRIDPGLASALRSRLDPVDQCSFRHQPIVRPTEIRLLTKKDMPYFHDEQWLAGVQDALPHCLNRTNDGRFVIGELTRIHCWDRGGLEELRMSNWMASDWRPKDSSSPIYSFFPSNSWWRMDEYSELAGARNQKAFALYLNPVFVHIGRAEFLAANPLPCSALGWRLSRDGISRWVHGDEIMVETVWWKDGPLQRAEVYNEEITAEGWLVLASPTAAREFAGRFPCVVRRQAVRTVEGEAPDHEEQFKIAELTLQPSELLGVNP